jgi:hypothetical protein
MTYQLKTDIVIDAPAERVWSIISDFDRYPEWNPFVVQVEGSLEAGAELAVELRPPGGSAMKFRPRVTALTPGKKLEWLGHLLVSGLFDGEHRFEVLPMGKGSTRLIHSERFSGVLVPLFRRMLSTRTRDGFEAMNRALKHRAESAVA